MSINVDTGQYALIAAARQEWITSQQADSARTGKAPQIVPPTDSQLIATFPPLGQEIAVLEAQASEVAQAGTEPETLDTSDNQPSQTSSAYSAAAAAQTTSTISSDASTGSDTVNDLASEVNEATTSVTDSAANAFTTLFGNPNDKFSLNIVA